jgi:hypothetical protein
VCVSSGNIQETLKEYSGKNKQRHRYLAIIQGTFKEHSRNIQGTFGEGRAKPLLHNGNSRTIQKTFREEYSGKNKQRHRYLARIHYYYYCDPRKGGQWRKTPR